MLDYSDPKYDDFEFFLVPYYLTIVQINGTITFIFHLFLIGIIVFKSSREMGHYRGFLLNIAIQSFIHDTILSTLWKPIPIGFHDLPIVGAFSAGPAKFLGAQFGGHFMLVCLVAFIVLYLVSILCGFFYRLIAVMKRKYYDVLMSPLGIGLLVSIHIIPTLALGIPLYYSNVEVGVVKDKILQRHPQLLPIFTDENVFLYDLQLNPAMSYFLMAAVICILALPPITGGCIYAILKVLHVAQHQLQARTIKLHRQLLIALIIQIILPVALIILPIVNLCAFIYFQLPHTSACIQGAIICCTFHSIADTCVMIFMIAPYRKATLRFFLMIIPRKVKLKMKPWTDKIAVDASRKDLTHTQNRSFRSGSVSIIA